MIAKNVYKIGVTKALLGILLGSQGYLLSRPGSSSVPEVPPFHVQWAGLAVQGSSVRPVPCSMDLYHRDEGTPGTSTQARNVHSPIPGRLGHQTPGPIDPDNAVGMGPRAVPIHGSTSQPREVRPEPV
jgi:hypothetical protein